MAAFHLALVLTYQSTAAVYLGTWFQKAIAKGRSLVSHLFTGTIPWVYAFEEVRWETDPCHSYSCRVGTNQFTILTVLHFHRENSNKSK